MLSSTHLLLLHTLSIIISRSAAGAPPSPQKRATAPLLKEHHLVPRSWTLIGPSPKTSLIQLHIGLVQQNPGAIEQHLLEISDPSHARYGKFLTQQEIHALVSPSEESTSLVEEWLRDHGIAEWRRNGAGDVIHCAMEIGKAEELLNTTYSTFRHVEDEGVEVQRAMEWSLPEFLHDHVEVVQPTTSFFRPRQGERTWGGSSGGGGGEEIVMAGRRKAKGKRQEVSADEVLSPPPQKEGGGDDLASICQADYVTPDCKRKLYGTMNYVPRAADKQSIATTNFLNQTVLLADITLFMQKFRPDAVNVSDNITMISIDGGDLTQTLTEEKISLKKGSEANLDVNNIASMAHPIPLTAYHTGGMPPFQPSDSTPRNTNEPYLDWLEYVLGQEQVPSVISSSYGDDEDTVPRSYAERVCHGFAQLGARGVSIVVSSGDRGVGEDGECTTNDGSNRQRFIARFPASCPWVTTVGATKEFEPEVCTTRFKSGGGFSNYFDRPEYQNPTVPDYVSSLKGKYSEFFNADGRGYPDVAAQGNHDTHYWNGVLSVAGGTSAAAPTFAGVIALVNDVLLSNGRAPLGFLNPWLYAKGFQGLTDVVTGDSGGCETDGFPAQEGWDAVSGFGTPRFRDLWEIALKSSDGSDGSDGSSGGGGGGGDSSGHENYS